MMRNPEFSGVAFRLRFVALALAALGLLWFGSAPTAHAASPVSLVQYRGFTRLNTVVFPSSLARMRSFSVAAGDVDGDGSIETVLAGGLRERPIVAVLNADGTLRTTFDVYGRGFSGGLEVAIGDLDGDGVAEILTAPASHGGPDVRVFNARGKLRLRFNAFDPAFHGGVHLAVGDVTGDGKPEIVVAAGVGGEPQVRIFTSEGQFAGYQWYAFDRGRHYGVRVAVGDIDGDGVSEVVAASGDSPATISVRTARGVERSSFPAFSTRVPGGARVAIGDADGNGTPDIVVTPLSDTSLLRALAIDGHEIARTVPPKGTVGVSLAAGPVDRMFVVVPNAPSVEGRTDLPRYISVDISDQKLRFFEEGIKIGERPVSTGKWSTPTPIGTFQIRNKMPVAYSRKYDLYMDWWMAFTPDGAYGLHSLPYWKLKNGGRYYEGVQHLGIRVSHGCIRQKLDDARSLYEWATVGTPVIVTE